MKEHLTKISLLWTVIIPTSTYLHAMEDIPPVRYQPRSLVDICCEAAGKKYAIEKKDPAHDFDNHEISTGLSSRIRLYAKSYPLIKKTADPTQALINVSGSWFFPKGTDPEALKGLLLRGADINAHDARGYTPLHWASWANRLDIATFLIAHGTYVDAPDAQGATPLHQTTNLAMIQLLHTAGADLNTRGVLGKTLLHTVSNLHIVSYLINNGALVDAQDNNGKTPLQYKSQAYFNSFEQMRILLEAGANPNIPDNSGNTPLHYLCEDSRKNHDAIILLLHFDAHPGLVNNNGKTPLSIVAHRNLDDAINPDIEMLRIFVNYLRTGEVPEQRRSRCRWCCDYYNAIDWT